MTSPNIETAVSRRTLSIGLIIATGCLVGVLLMTDLLSGSGNSLAKLARALAIGGFIGGFFNPRLGVYLLIISTAYLDLLKRLLVFYDRPTMVDLYYVLGVAPLIMAGATAGVVGAALLGRIQLSRVHWLLLAFAIACNALVSAAAFRDGGVMQAGATVANASFYCMLLFVIPSVFRSAEDFWKLLRFVLWVFVPVAAYGIYQSIFGFSMYEIAYLNSGLTIMVKELDDIRPRPFSTLNSSGALAFASSTLFVLALVPWITRRAAQPLTMKPWVYTLLAILFFVSTIASLARSAHIVWLIALPTLFFFSTRRRTIFFYATSVGGYLILVFNAKWVLKMLPIWDSYMPKDNAFFHQLTRLQTFSERLQGYEQLSRWETYSWFGLDYKIFSHDAITTGIGRFGLFPVALIALIVATILTKVHRRILSLPSVADRRLASVLLGLSIATFAGGALVGGVFGTFPNNVYWWLLMGGLMVMTLARPNELESPVVEIAPAPDASPPPENKRRGFPFGQASACQ